MVMALGVASAETCRLRTPANKIVVDRCLRCGLIEEARRLLRQVKRSPQRFGLCEGCVWVCGGTVPLVYDNRRRKTQNPARTLLLRLQRGELVEVRGKERAAAGQLGEDVLGDGPGEAEAVEGGGAAVWRLIE